MVSTQTKRCLESIPSLPKQLFFQGTWWASRKTRCFICFGWQFCGWTAIVQIMQVVKKWWLITSQEFFAGGPNGSQNHEKSTGIIRSFLFWKRLTITNFTYTIINYIQLYNYTYIHIHNHIYKATLKSSTLVFPFWPRPWAQNFMTKFLQFERAPGAGQRADLTIHH